MRRPPAASFVPLAPGELLGGAALLWWGIASKQPIAVAAGVASLIAFAVLVVIHARVLDEVERAETAPHRRAGPGPARARLGRAAGSAGAARLDMDAHPYARDLDVFGHASVAKWLGRPATAKGRAGSVAMAARALPAPDEIADRQAAVDELAAKSEWRETLAIEGELTAVSPAELERVSRMGRVERSRLRGARNAGGRRSFCLSASGSSFALLLSRRH